MKKLILCLYVAAVATHLYLANIACVRRLVWTTQQFSLVGGTNMVPGLHMTAVALAGFTSLSLPVLFAKGSARTGRSDRSEGRHSLQWPSCCYRP